MITRLAIKNLEDNTYFILSDEYSGFEYSVCDIWGNKHLMRDKLVVRVRLEEVKE